MGHPAGSSTIAKEEADSSGNDRQKSKGKDRKAKAKTEKQRQRKKGKGKDGAGLCGFPPLPQEQRHGKDRAPGRRVCKLMASTILGLLFDLSGVNP